MRLPAYIFHISAGLIFLLVFTLAPPVVLQRENPPAKPPSEPLTIIFSGDFMQHMPQVRAARAEDGSFDYSPVFRSIGPYWKSADFAIVNLETTVSTNAKYSGYPMFRSPSQVAYALRDAGVDITVLANNHCVDGGESGVRATLHHLDSAGILHTGIRMKNTVSDSILVFGRDDYRVALLNYTYDTNGIPVPKNVSVNHIDTTLIKRDITLAHERNSSHIIVFFHWGIEYSRHPNKEQRQIAAWCRANGVDIVIGSHPHVVQPIDTANRIVYSLGNLVSNQSQRYTDGGISVKVTLHGDSMVNIDYTPHWVDIYGKDRYRILLPGDTVINNNPAFMRSLEDNRKIVEGS